MSAKRDIINEIKAFKDRMSAERGIAGDTHYFDRLQAVSDLLGEIIYDKVSSSVAAELDAHICVSLVAIIQSVVRQVLTFVVDAKEHRGEALPELRDAKLTLAIARELKNQTVTFGDLITHFLPLSNVDKLSNAVSYVTGEDLIAFVKPYLRKQPREGESTLDTTVAAFGRNLRALFERRNVVCHEALQCIPADAGKLLGFLSTTLDLIQALHLSGLRYVDPTAYAKIQADEAKPAMAGGSVPVNGKNSQATA
jgi:hypothetical protein